MAVASATQIRAAFVTALQNKLGLEDQQIVGYVISNPQLPTVWVRLAPNTPVEYNVTFGDAATGIQKWTFLIEAYTGDVDDEAAQRKMDEYLSPGAKSIYEALVADHTLGGTVQSLKVASVPAAAEYKRADGSAAAGVNWLVEVYP